MIRDTFSVVLMRTVLELGGTPAMPVEEETASKQQVLVSRSFSEPIWEPTVIGDAVAEFAQRATRRLRKEHQETGQLMVFASTSAHRVGPDHAASVHVRLPAPTAEPGVLAAAARASLVPRLQSGVPYMRAGVLCVELTPAGVAPMLEGLGELVAPVGALVDEINARFGTGTLGLGRPGTRVPGAWANQQHHLSQCYTTDWKQLRTVY